MASRNSDSVDAEGRSQTRKNTIQHRLGLHVRPMRRTPYLYTIKPGTTFFKERPKPVAWLVEGLIPVQSTTLLAGDGGTGKSLFAQALAVAVASGQPLFNTFAVPEPRVVVYVQSESSMSALQRRFLDITRGYGLTPDDLGDRLIIIDNTDAPFQLDQESIKLAQARTDSFTQEVVVKLHPALVIIDPLVDFHSADENSVKEMSPVVQVLRDWRDKHHVSTLVLHHTNKNYDVTSGAAKTRGSTHLRNSMDGRWLVTRDAKSGWSKMKELFLKEQPKGRLFQYRPATGPDGTDFDFKWSDDKGDATTAEHHLSDRQLLKKIRDRQPCGYKEIQEITGYNDSKVRREVDRLLKSRMLERDESEKVVRTTRHMFKVSETGLRRLPNPSANRRFSG